MEALGIAAPGQATVSQGIARMKRRAVRILATAAFAVSGAVVAAPPPATVKLKAVKVAPHSWYVEGMRGLPSKQNQGFTSNAGFVVTSAGVVVFDALGTPPLGEALLREIRRVTRQPVRRVIVSHYHADHFYGLAAFKRAGAEIWADRSVEAYLRSDAPRLRLEERKTSLAPWVDESLKIVVPDRYLDSDATFELGGLHFTVSRIGPAHTAEDLTLAVREDGVMYVGDLIFAGRVPFVGDADSRAWIAAIDKVLAGRPRILVTGHGSVSKDAGADLSLTRDYLVFLRRVMADAVRDFVPFEEVLKSTDWSRYSKLPAFEAANRINAYGTYLLMEKESLGK
jgi:glyoxylase-like metal-dependent hydrolase (beta-lactamase superfamily II)